ncbi:hypothetical protein PG2115B_1383 [Bifidobacterium pseudolongum subsp. globosum]|uniref:hypothetical protein n=1 Tax=Bifidobacterium pseudolongum TaxID=1694 RepID=UPI0010DE1726|nr:hypothetical protein [Bifidobacterium pseudolongum]RYP99325.1 hypothetical protein PG2115B_1383 [Bifidobacterium pseudolongum subsp. globosum]RYQ04952.1 hypothetical protein PG2114B_1388 [Bifidobacterium pseudolongum subsp. globosum]
MTMRADSSNIAQYRELTQMVDFVETEWGFNEEFDGPTFLWDPTISSCSQHEDARRNPTPVAQPDEARLVMAQPMQWYFDGIAAITPSATPTPEGGMDVPCKDMPSFRMESQALAGVEAVVANALASTQWLDATRNLCMAVELTARFIGSCEDRHQECLEYLKELIQLVRIYMDSVARNADPETSAQALRMVTDVACNEDFRINPMPMVELLSCCLSFAQWDDTRVFAYETLNNAVASMDDMARQYGDDAIADARFREMVTGEYAHEFADLDGFEGFDDEPDPDTCTDRRELELHAHFHFKQAMLLMRHDLMRMSGDANGADTLLREHCTLAPLADAYAARLIHARRWRDLLEFIDDVEARRPEQFTIMFPEDLVPYDWESLREIALQGLDERGQLQEIYRARVLGAFDMDELAALTNLRRLCDDRTWDEQSARIVDDYHREGPHLARNPVYEHMLVMRAMRNEAMRYLEDFPDAWPDLAAIL